MTLGQRKPPPKPISHGEGTYIVSWFDPQIKRGQIYYMLSTAQLLWTVDNQRRRKYPNGGKKSRWHLTHLVLLQYFVNYAFTLYLLFVPLTALNSLICSAVPLRNYSLTHSRWKCPRLSCQNHCPSVLWSCWLGHMTSKIVPEMTYNVSSETLNSTESHCPSVLKVPWW